MKGGLLLLLEEVRFTVTKDNRVHHKLLFNLEVEDEKLLISTKCRGVPQLVTTNLETLLTPHLRPDEIKMLRTIATKVYSRKLKEVS